MAGGLGMNGTMMMIGAVGAFTVDSPDLPRRRAALKGGNDSRPFTSDVMIHNSCAVPRTCVHFLFSLGLADVPAVLYFAARRTNMQCCVSPVEVQASLRSEILMKFRRITVDPKQMGGVPCIRGLRIPVATVVGMMADGMSTQGILAAYPDLEPDDVQEALHYVLKPFASANCL
jgi:uncharacterized protein (DUF433 family)